MATDIYTNFCPKCGTDNAEVVYCDMGRTVTDHRGREICSPDSLHPNELFHVICRYCGYSWRREVEAITDD